MVGVGVKRSRCRYPASVRFAHVALIVLGVCLVSFRPAISDTPSKPNIIQELLVSARTPDIDFKSLDVASLRAFYARRGYEPAWSGSAAAEALSRGAVSVLEQADQEGLDPLDYHAGKSMLRSAPADPLEQAERDILLTDGVLRYASELRSGRPSLRNLDPDVDLPAQSFNAAAELDAALATRSLMPFLENLAPAQPEYARLKEALAQYRRIVSNGGWRPLPPTTSVDVDETSASGIALRERLAFEDDRVGSPESDESLGEAVKRFQLRHGLEADGRIGPRTLDALNVPASQRVMEIEANMERWRWLPRSLEPVRIAINIPGGQLDVIANGESVLSSRVIVGRPQAPTPILRALATSVTVNPPWNVPTAIARNEILAKLRREPDYLQSENMILLNGPPGDPYGLRIDWANLRGFPYRLQQQPGPKNALGQIKLELPNRFDVYLHDTPAKTAFDLNERSLSHGCVRVQQILPLASYALSDDANAMIAQLNDAIATGTTQHISMSRPIPVYFLYWTAYVDGDGTVQFRPDVYGRDLRLIAAVGGRAIGQRVTSNVTECHNG